VKTQKEVKSVFFFQGKGGWPNRGITVCAGSTESGQVCVGESVMHTMQKK